MPRTAVWMLSCAALCWLLPACGSAPEDQLEQARSYLAAGDYTGAAAAATRGLEAGAEGATAWRLELTALEAEARGGRTAEVLVRLGRLAETWPAQLEGPLYVQTAGQLKEAGDAAGAVGVLDAGAKRFPENPDLLQAIERLQATGSDEEIDRLRSLGYVE
jgi:hypothetical protein